MPRRETEEMLRVEKGMGKISTTMKTLTTRHGVTFGNLFGRCASKTAAFLSNFVSGLTGRKTFFLSDMGALNQR